MITGMRRVGKSTSVKYLLAKIGHTNQLYLDCERVEIRVLLNQPDYESIREALELRGIDLSRPCVIAIDEIQLVSGLPSLIKYLYDTYEVKFIVTGSSSFYMKNTFSESLAGRKRIFEMYPLSFREFLVFKQVWQDQYEKQAWQPFSNAWYRLAKDWYKEYLAYGGFPEVVLETDGKAKKELLIDILNSYIELDVKLLADFTAAEELFKLVRLLAARSGNRVEQLSSGQVLENAIAVQLKPLGELQYFQKRSGQEIDFIFKRELAMEVKETPVGQDKNLLLQRAAAIGIDQHRLIGRYPPAGGFGDFLWAGSIF